MSLASAPPVFAYHTDNYATGTPTIPGTQFTAGASGSDGASVSCVSALGHDVHFLRISLGGANVNTGDGNAAGDLLVDPAGGTSWSALVNDLVFGMSTSLNGGPTHVYEIPLYIPAGSSLGFRGKTAHTADLTACYALIQAYGEPSKPQMWWCGQGVETLGISDSKGTSVTPGSTGSWGSWTSVGSTSARHHKAIIGAINGSDSNSASSQYHWQVGVGSAQVPGSAMQYMNMGTAENRVAHFAQNLATCNYPAGTQYQMRGKASGSGEAFFCAVYGVY